MIQMPLNVLSAFAGVGMIDYGMERAGCRIAGQVEIDEYCRRVLAKHWPGVWRYGDIKELLKEGSGDHGPGEFILRHCGVDRIDILTGGVPCQPASVAGKRGGTKDPRWLWPEFLSLVSAVSPLCVLAENPCDVLGVDVDGVRFREWISLQFQARGYSLFPVMLSAESVGAPHRRERLWLLAYADRPWQHQPQEHLEESWRRIEYSGNPLYSDAGELANPGGGRRHREQEGQGAGEGGRERLAAPGQELDYSSSLRPEWTGDEERRQSLRPPDGGRKLVDASRIGLAQILRQSRDDGEEFQAFERTDWPMGQGPWQYDYEEPRIISKPQMGAAANGDASGLARWSRTRRAAVKAIGNAAVPQIAEILGKTIARFIRYQYQIQEIEEKEKRQ